jgi:signal peptidase I
MKYLIMALVFLPTSATAMSWGEFWENLNKNNYSNQRSGYGPMCNEYLWREVYIPGDQIRPGYVRRWKERVYAPCYLFDKKSGMMYNTITQ